MKPILILGLGNPLQGDDGIGSAIVEELERYTLADNVDCVDGGMPGVGLVNLIQGRRRVILVDAARMGRAPGDIVRLTAEEIDSDPDKHSVSLHSVGISDALALAHTMQIELPEIICFGIEPLVVDWQQGLSAPVQKTVPIVAQAILDLISAWENE